MKNLTLAALALLTMPAWAQLPARRTAPAEAPKAVAQRQVAANPNFRLTQLVMQKYRVNITPPAAWLDTLRYTYSRFSATNQPKRVLRENAPTRGAALRPLRQDNLQYTVANKLASDSTFVYNTSGTLNSYPTLVETYTYNAQNQLLTDQLNVRIGSNLNPYGRTSYTYNAQGQNTSIVDEGYFGGSWNADSRDLLSYDAQGRLISDEFQTVDASGTGFVPAYLNLYTYDAAGNRLTDQEQSYNNGAYSNTFLTTFTYNGPQAQRDSYTLVRNAGGATVNVLQGTITYDADGNETQEVQLRWNATTQAYVNDIRYLYTYQRNPLGTATGQTLQAALTVAPNPGSSQAPVVLHYALPAAAPVSVTVFDALGRPVTTVTAGPQAAGSHELSLPATTLAAGLYQVRLTADRQSQTVKLEVR